MDKLAIDGGDSIYKQPFPIRPKTTPASDLNPSQLLQKEFSDYLNIDPKQIVIAESYELACQEIVRSFEQYGEGIENILLPIIGTNRISKNIGNLNINLHFGDVDAETGNISSRAIANSFTENTHVLICKHNFGHPVNFDEISMITQSHKCLIIEDASASIGATYKNMKTGLLGDIAIFGFGESHLLHAEGHHGAVVVVKNLEIANILYTNLEFPSKETSQLLLAEFRNREIELLNRRRLAWELDLELRNFKGIRRMEHANNIKHSYDKYVLRVRSLLWKRDLEDTINALLAEGIQCEIAYPVFNNSNENLSTKENNHPSDEYPVATRLAKESIALPLHTGMNYLDIEKILTALRKIESASI